VICPVGYGVPAFVCRGASVAARTVDLSTEATREETDAMTTDRTDAPDAVAAGFFDRYRQALLDRDEAAVADLYAVPALILFPGQSLPVTSRAQTEQFFGASWSQYEGVTGMTSDVRVVAATAHSVWAEVTWHHEGADDGTERFVYQLVRADDGWRIAVLTPMDV